MKNLKKIMALLVAALLVLAMAVPAFAESTTAIHIQGIKAGDTVYTYKVIKMNETTGQWEWNIDGMTDDELTEVVGHYEGAKPAVTDPETGVTTPAVAGHYVNGSISEATAAKMANIVKELVGTGTEADAATLDVEGDAGLYCVLVTAVDADTVYNPAFAAIQYDQTGAKENDDSTIDFASLTYSDTAKVKKSTIDVTKEATATDGDATTNKVGDIVTFTVTTKIPAFGKNFTSPKYIVSDTMSAGLEFQSFTSITVDSNTVDTTSGKVGETSYIKTIESETTGFTLTFDPAYLITNTTVKDVTIVYTAKVTDAAVKNVNPETNTVEVEFSNNPQDLDDSKKIQDETRHYTFSIDMDLLGNDEWETSEFVKIGVDNDGNPITEEKTMDNGTTTNPLAGATFRITTKDGDTYTDYTNENSGNWVLTTDADGKLNITGLDAGTYYLIETEAPTGYIPDKTPIEVVITPTYETISMDPDGIAGSGDEYTYQALKSYTITIGGTTSTYTMTNEGLKKDKEVSKGDQTKEWANKKGTELPSTGGVGTTIFYIAGAILVLGAGIVLVSRRKAR